MQPKALWQVALEQRAVQQREAADEVRRAAIRDGIAKSRNRGSFGTGRRRHPVVKVGVEAICPSWHRRNCRVFLLRRGQGCRSCGRRRAA